MKYNIEWLHHELGKDKRIKYLHFWGNKPEKGGTIGAGCLSQWWGGHTFREAGLFYPTAEHYMMAGKAKLFADPENLDKILQASSPAEAKKWGREVRGFEAKLWTQHRCEIVVAGNYLKFSQNEALRDYLLGTQDRVLVEASPVDPIWGIGLAKDDPRAHEPYAWRGKNLLGFCLMEVRDRLQLAGV